MFRRMVRLAGAGLAITTLAAGVAAAGGGPAFAGTALNSTRMTISMPATSTRSANPYTARVRTQERGSFYGSVTLLDPNGTEMGTFTGNIQTNGTYLGMWDGNDWYSFTAIPAGAAQPTVGKVYYLSLRFYSGTAALWWKQYFLNYEGFTRCVSGTSGGGVAGIYWIVSCSA
jgi:hypothetical protein